MTNADSVLRPETSPGARSGLYYWLFAWLLSHGEGADRRLYGDRKVQLLGSLRGTVVEIGAGAGVNLPYLDRSTRYVAVEPNVHFHDRITEAARLAGVAAEVRTGVAENLPLPDSSADAVVSTLVLCSVRDQDRALAEVIRVLRPGGTFVFLEHVAASRGSWLRRMQRLIRGPWTVVADGCRPDRETADRIAAAGFENVEMDRFQAPLGLLSPHIAGWAEAPGAAA
jgi:SAM-dependent methyltransferase